MTGLLCVVNADRRPVDDAALAPLIDRIAYRGATTTIMQPQPHVRLVSSTGDEEPQPAKGNGRNVIMDGLLTERQRLRRELRERGIAPAAGDAGLILAAHEAHRSDLASRLTGEFGAVIWDDRSDSVLVVGDHLGIRPLYYHVQGPTLLVSNELTALRRYPGVSDELDDHVVGDFLMYGDGSRFNRDRTVFADIKRLPPAHVLSYSAEGLHLRRYWDFPISRETDWHADPGEYLEHFRVLLDEVVADRLDGHERGSLMLSGGLDSTAIAASVRALIDGGGVQFALNCLNASYEHVEGHDETRLAKLAADRLGFDFDFVGLDPYRLTAPVSTLAEPAIAFRTGMQVDLDRRLSAHGPLVLTGHGADELLPWTRLHQVLLRRRLPEAVALYVKLWRLFGRRPAVGGYKRYVRQLVRNGNPDPDFVPPHACPGWLQPDFERRTHLRRRWEEVLQDLLPQDGRSHPMQPEVAVAMTHASWPTGYEYMEPPDFPPARFSLPFCDRRLIDFALSLPPGPFSERKCLIRESMRGRLPAEVLKRPKRLAPPFYMTQLQREGTGWVDDWADPHPRLAEYVDVGRIPKIAGGVADQSSAMLNSRPLFLDQWLHALDRSP